MKEQTKPGDRVGILGLGGLGHMVKCGPGCEVAIFFLSQKRESIEHGAKHYILHADRRNGTQKRNTGLYSRYYRDKPK